MWRYSDGITPPQASSQGADTGQNAPSNARKDYPQVFAQTDEEDEEEVMPLRGVRFRVKTTKTGKKVRLAFRGNKVVEAKRLRSAGKSRRSHRRKKKS